MRLRRFVSRHDAFNRALLDISCILAGSAVYVIIEWGMAMTFAPDWAEAYNGQQGDVWDAQRDMALAAIGAFFAASATWILKKRNHGRIEPL
jgi:putative membrane protein